MKGRIINVFVWRKMKYELYKSYRRSMSDLVSNMVVSENVELYFQEKWKWSK